MSAPLLSIVVPTEGRLREIRALVESVQKARSSLVSSPTGFGVPNDAIELLLVDSSEPLLDPSSISAWDPSWMRVYPGTRSVRQKRNSGADSARAAWVAFVDSDCVISPGYLAAVLAAISTRDVKAFAGKLEFSGSENFVWRAIKGSQLATPETQTEGDGEVNWCATANLIIERSLFVSLGGFDETLPFRLGGDDVDLGLRLQRRGQALQVLPRALVVHPKAPWSRLRGIIPRTWRWGRVEYHLGRRHRERLRFMPPFFTAAAMSFALASVIGAALTHHLALLLLPPLWMLLATVIATLLVGRGSEPFHDRYLAGSLSRLYHLGCAWEHIRAGSLRFVWQALILEDRLEALFPAEPLQCWSNLVAALLVALLGVAIVSR